MIKVRDIVCVVMFLAFFSVKLHASQINCEWILKDKEPHSQAQSKRKVLVKKLDDLNSYLAQFEPVPSRGTILSGFELRIVAGNSLIWVPDSLSHLLETWKLIFKNRKDNEVVIAKIDSLLDELNTHANYLVNEFLKRMNKFKDLDYTNTLVDKLFTKGKILYTAHSKAQVHKEIDRALGRNLDDEEIQALEEVLYLFEYNQVQ